ncbi:MAG: ATP-binding protein [Bacteroidales bacterium]|nr:ATP-binding protein [Bacteroidales bacterium]
MIERLLQSKIENAIDSKKAVVLIGARQVGKSTLLHQLLDEKDDVLWLSGDNAETIDMLKDATVGKLRTIIGRHTTLVIDEAQRIPDIGLKLKLITDQIGNVQIFASGSSSFELTSKVNEPLTGRKREFKLFPLSFAEMVQHTNYIAEVGMLPQRLVYGYYPEVVNNIGAEPIVLKELIDSYLFKDIFSLDGITKSSKIVSLLKALALQVGNLVSYNEIGNLIGMDSKTVEKYIDIMEKSFIVFRLGSFSRNVRNELKASKKIYFWDLGIRNALINNFNPLENRNDIGALWENFAITERLKQNEYGGQFVQSWFWRTQQQSEIDYLEDSGGNLSAYEFKWNSKKMNTKCPVSFTNSYPDAHFKVITPNNIEDFLSVE